MSSPQDFLVPKPHNLDFVCYVLCFILAFILYCPGGSRYIPGGGGSQSGLGGETSDPFTGAGRYRPGTGGSAYTPSPGPSHQGGSADPFTGQPCSKVLAALQKCELLYYHSGRFLFHN